MVLSFKNYENFYYNEVFKMSNNIKAYSWNIVKHAMCMWGLFSSGFEHKVNEKEIVLQIKQSKL